MRVRSWVLLGSAPVSAWVLGMTGLLAVLYLDHDTDFPSTLWTVWAQSIPADIVFVLFVGLATATGYRLGRYGHLAIAPILGAVASAAVAWLGFWVAWLVSWFPHRAGSYADFLSVGGFVMVGVGGALGIVSLAVFSTLAGVLDDPRRLARRVPPPWPKPVTDARLLARRVR